MAEELVGCLCSSLAGLMGAVRDAVAHAEGLPAPSDVLSAAAEGSSGIGRSEEQAGGGGGGPSAASVAALLLLLLVAIFSAFRTSRQEFPAKAPRRPETGSHEEDMGPPVA